VRAPVGVDLESAHALWQQAEQPDLETAWNTAI